MKYNALVYFPFNIMTIASIINKDLEKSGYLYQLQNMNVHELRNRSKQKFTTFSRKVGQDHLTNNN